MQYFNLHGMSWNSFRIFTGFYKQQPWGFFILCEDLLSLNWLLQMLWYQMPVTKQHSPKQHLLSLVLTVLRELAQGNQLLQQGAQSEAEQGPAQGALLPTAFTTHRAVSEQVRQRSSFFKISEG